MKKVLSIMLALFMVVTMLPLSVLPASAASASYNGTPVTPLKIDESNYAMLGLTEESWSDYSGYYAIRNASELYGFAALVNGGDRSINGVLLQDIVVNTSVSASGAVYSWTPIGATRETAFLGTFDGAGHSISGIYYKDISAEYVGLFGNIGEYFNWSGANVKNLTLKNSYINGKHYVGGIVGSFWGYNASVSNCKTDSDVTVIANCDDSDSRDQYFYLGGIVGDSEGSAMSQSCYVKNCVNLATVIGNWLNKEEFYNFDGMKNKIGAITGGWQAGTNAGETVIVSNCYFLKNSAKVNRNSDEAFVNFGCGGTGDSWVHNKGCTILDSASAAHTCVAVATPEIKANCTYGGHSAYSYCLICGSVTSGTKTLTEANDTHFYKGATCTVNGVCQLCGDANGPKNPDNHISWIPANCMAPATCKFCSVTKGEKNPANHSDAGKFTYTVNANDESKHDAFYEQCKAFSYTEGHSYDAEGKCTKCTYQCAHPSFTDSVCDTCAYKCTHSNIENNKCTVCGLEGSIKYINRVWNSTAKQVEETVEIAPVSITEVTAETTAMTDGWYIVNDTVDIDEWIMVSGTVHLILADGASLTTGACRVNEGNSLYIYAQANGESMGSWKLSGAYNRVAMLGGAGEAAAGRIVINGGFIQASVESREGAAIGSGYKGTGGEVIINGGFVKASNDDYGAAIGSGYLGTPGIISINGGTVYASAEYGAGIGSGRYGEAGNVTLNGGNIYATSYGGKKVGAGWSGDPVTVTDGSGNDVTLRTITLSGAAADTPVTKVEGITYGLTDVKTYNTDKLYFYLPADAVITSITAGGNEYICNSNLTYYTSHDWSNLDGICANGCGLECTHENETGDICSVCGVHCGECTYTDNGDGTHSFTCTICHITGTENHTGGTATCKEQAKCEHCGASYGELDKTNHDETVEYDNGFCTECDAYEPAELKDGYYQIKNGGNLFWYANYINTVDRTANAVLTADIDLENRPWTPIGSTGENSNNFRGHFDGQNHTITGLNVEGGRAGLGFFGEVRLGTVENFTIYGEVKLNGKYSYVGGVIGSAPGASSSDGSVRNGATIRNITSYVNVTLGEDSNGVGAHGSGYVGGFIGYTNHETLIENCTWYGTLDLGIYRAQSGVGGLVGAAYNNSSVTIRDCAAYGTIKTAYKSGTYNNQATIYIGGIVSNSVASASTTIENTIWAGTIVNDTDLGANAHISAFGTLSGIKGVVNCYALENSAPYITTNNANSDGITEVTAEQLTSGETAYKLGDSWGQKIGTDEKPILGGEKVYYGYTSCADDAVMVYTNDSAASDTKPDHAWGEGSLTRPTKTQDGYYTYTCSACGKTKTEPVERAANYDDYTKALEDLRAYLDSDMLTDENKSNISEWLATYDTDEAYGFIAGEEETVQMYIDATAYYASEFEAAIEDCLAGNHSGNGETCSVCGATIKFATVTDGTNTYYAADAATLNQAVTAILETGSRTFTVELPADAEAEMITAIRRAICDTEGVADGSINLTLKGVTSIPGTTNWDGVAFGPGDIYDEAGKIVDQELVTQLTSINLPDATEIGAQAFYFCENLVAVSAPKAQ
ncbi:MAG: hypothetical protein IJO14_07955, partial [Clostridia bacterium]|nr:hypothetical protein [Clostridia bacterium]